MWLDAVNLREFYSSPLGLMTQQVIGNHVRELWPSVKGMNVLGIGFPTPYLNAFHSEATRVISAMPLSEGTLHWPNEIANQKCLTLEAELPLPDLSIDRVLMVHAVECVESVRPMMREIWRVLTGTGRIIVITPNRRGIWARLERTPFGSGRPYSPAQLSILLRDTMFTPLTTNGALYAPPSKSRMIISWAHAWEKLGKRWFPALGGVISVEASKQIYGATLSGESAKRHRYTTVISQ